MAFGQRSNCSQPVLELLAVVAEMLEACNKQFSILYLLK